MAVHDMLMAAAGGTSVAATYIDDYFSTFVYSGTGANENYNNGMDFVTNGGMCWIKKRNGSTEHQISDTARGNGWIISSSDTYGQGSGGVLESLNSNGFSVKNDDKVNASGGTYVAWSFLKKEKFFDVVTYTGDGSSSRAVSHNLKAVPGCVIIKKINTTGNWVVGHRSINDNQFLELNGTGGASTDSAHFPGTARTSTEFYVGNEADVNQNGATYVAYLFAHNAGGFGTAGTDNVISCGSCAGNATVNLGYEPQWILMKRTNATGSWILVDNMRGMVVDGGTGGDAYLLADTSGAEVTAASMIDPSATGFTMQRSSADTYIYIAIRRPMKPPTTGTSVFSPVFGTSSAPAYNSGFVSDAFLGLYTAGDASYPRIGSRLTGTNWMRSSGTEAEAADGIIKWDYMNGVYSGYMDSGYVGEIFRRAPGFFDVVCFTTQASTNMRIAHNLGVAPELILMKSRNLGSDWNVYYPTGAINKYLVLNSTATSTTTSGYNFWGSTAPSSTDFGLNVNETYGADATMVAYLFATVAGVSKVGSYTGTGSTQQINCGFSGGARFVMIKRTDSTGGWYVWDTARGIVSGNDPYQLINTNNAQVTNTDYIDPYSAGFEISSTAPAAINASGGTYIYLAIS